MRPYIIFSQIIQNLYIKFYKKIYDNQIHVIIYSDVQGRPLFVLPNKFLIKDKIFENES